MAVRWTRWTVIFAAGIALSLVTSSSLTAGQLSGAIFTTLKDGSRVNANLYPSKADVYLDGGPGPNAPAKAAGLPKGDYYFQVTDPAGKVLLSQDPVTSRKFHVNAAGVIDRVYTHASGVDRDHKELGALTVQLMPYSDTPNPGGEYKVWATPVEKFAPDGPNFGFANACSKTDNFKVVIRCVGGISIEAPPDVTAEQMDRAGTPLDLGSPRVIYHGDCHDQHGGCDERKGTCRDRHGDCDDRHGDCDDRQGSRGEQGRCGERGGSCDERGGSSDGRQGNCGDRRGDCDDRHGDCDDRQGDCDDRHGDCDDRHGNCDDRHGDCDGRQGDCDDRHERCKDCAFVVTNDAPAVFPLGTTVVTWTVTDCKGNVATATQNVTIVDTTPPVLIVPDPITVEQATAAGTKVEWTCSASDICDANVDIVCVPPSGTVFPLGGPYTVTCTATDDSCNQTVKTFPVKVVDTTPPELTVHEDITVEQTESGGTPASDVQLASFMASAAATDICDAQPIVTNNAPSTFPLGTTTVTFTARDFAGNTTTRTASVTVGDTTKPALIVPDDITVDQTTPAGTPATNAAIAAFLAAALATDICDANPTITNDAPEVFPPGPTVVTFTATDSSNNWVSGTATVIVEGAPAIPMGGPTITVPTDITVEQTQLDGTPATRAAVTQFMGLALAVDTSGTSLAITNDAPAVFPLGATVVTFTAKNSFGKTATGTAAVTVVDTTPPMLTLIVPEEGIAVDQDEPEGTPATNLLVAAFLASVSASASATDICDADPTITSDAPAVFPYGLTVVTFTATDFSGNTMSLTATTVTVFPPP